tara:strand:+ start:475 stop:666 length:192 start_codon:yes stop_codon:yes gene_type:complete
MVDFLLRLCTEVDSTLIDWEEKSKAALIGAHATRVQERHKPKKIKMPPTKKIFTTSPYHINTG